MTTTKNGWCNVWTIINVSYMYVDDKNDSDDGEDEEGKRYY